MLKIHVLSDLHTEFADFDAPATDADVIVLAGDIGVGVRGLYWAAGEKALRGKPVLYVPGNHEFYDARLERMAVEMRHAAAELGIHYLDNNVLDLDGVRFIGSTLWTDFLLMGDDMRRVSRAMMAAKETITDFNAIIYGTTGWFTPGQSVALHQAARRFIEDSLGKPFAGPKVVVSHHAPHRRCVAPEYEDSELSPAFVSDLAPLMERHRIAAWIYGHTHTNISFEVENGCQVVSNQRGYPGEETGDFIPDLVVAVSA